MYRGLIFSAQVDMIVPHLKDRSHLWIAFVIPLLLINHHVSFLVIAEKNVKRDRKAFEALRKTILQESGSFVHPSIGLMSPAPCGAPRGIGMVKKVVPSPNNDDVLIKVPYSYQMTRELAISTLIPLLPTHEHRSSFLELDDAALLVLLLAYEYGIGKKSKFYSYIQALPSNGGCGWASVDDFRNLPPEVSPDDVEHALLYAHRVANGLMADFGAYLYQKNSTWPEAWRQEDPAQALLWSLCMVSSRGTAAAKTITSKGGNDTSVGIRLIPLVDFVNHRTSSGGFIELTGQEQMANGDFIDAKPSDSGAFVVRSIWKCGTTREMSEGDEITVNYNLHDYSALDWFLSLGFVPPELSSISSSTPSSTQHNDEL